jgi:hypothetical protein
MLPTFLEAGLRRMQSAESGSLYVYAANIAINCLYYNPPLTLTLMEERGVVGGFFASLRTKVGKFRRYIFEIVFVSLSFLLILGRIVADPLSLICSP